MLGQDPRYCPKEKTYLSFINFAIEKTGNKKSTYSDFHQFFPDQEYKWVSRILIIVMSIFLYLGN